MIDMVNQTVADLKQLEPGQHISGLNIGTYNAGGTQNQDKSTSATTLQDSGSEQEKVSKTKRHDRQVCFKDRRMAR
jgi:hypothetical protein